MDCRGYISYFRLEPVDTITGELQKMGNELPEQTDTFSRKHNSWCDKKS